jgi:N-acetylglucosamine malate deacetylase 1
LKRAKGAFRKTMQRPQFLDAVFQRTAASFLQRIHRITHRMPVKLRSIESRRVLVVAPHPDDESIAMGGSLSLHQLAASEVKTLFVTLEAAQPDGIVVRKGEAERAAELLGFDHEFLGFPDGAVSHHEAAVAGRVHDVIRSFRPDAIYCPFPGDHHRDHQAASASTAAAVDRVGFRGEIWCYETWSNLWPNVAVDISSVVDRKRAAIDCYQSQVAYMPYAEAVLGLNRFRGLKLGVPYAEAFYVCDGPSFVSTCRTLDVV